MTRFACAIVSPTERCYGDRLIPGSTAPVFELDHGASNSPGRALRGKAPRRQIDYDLDHLSAPQKAVVIAVARSTRCFVAAKVWWLDQPVFEACSDQPA